MRVAIVAGGTGGHIYPGIAIAQEIMRRDPKAELLFLGSREGLEKELIPKADYPIRYIWARPLLRNFFVSLVGFFQALIILKSFSPRALVSTGGYASLPAVLAASLLRIRIVLHEQNVLPGAVNRFCRKFAKKTFLSFERSVEYMPGEVVGNPVRREIVEAEREPARKKLNFKPDEKVVLVMGGSQGSKKINQSVISALDRLPSNIKIVHLIGNRDFGWVERYWGGKKINNYKALPYLYEMGDVLAASDLAVSRAGATAIAEFLVKGLPMVLVPFPFAAEDHQRLNAAAVTDSGCAAVVEDKDFTAENFLHHITNPGLNYAKMREASLKLAKPKAAERIVDFIYA
jgi:UDP-N-acetylglucosamine--N-acetylmuramyl-(pentapeptide) pyrophosphoryl-undecaprenol N-acetylglucosamine transferase